MGDLPEQNHSVVQTLAGNREDCGYKVQAQQSVRGRRDDCRAQIGSPKKVLPTNLSDMSVAANGVRLIEHTRDVRTTPECTETSPDQPNCLDKCNPRC